MAVAANSSTRFSARPPSRLRCQKRRRQQHSTQSLLGLAWVHRVAAFRRKVHEEATKTKPQRSDGASSITNLRRRSSCFFQAILAQEFFDLFLVSRPMPPATAVWGKSKGPWGEGCRRPLPPPPRKKERNGNQYLWRAEGGEVGGGGCPRPAPFHFSYCARTRGNA